ncbi:tetratricopeptide repeat protein [Qipengyuania sp. S6317L1]|uniref:tetratricopeptide repeat protein n=1 Tax=Qipengyuania sp. S6317L1 TaxID=2926410 RepID=UPI001FF6D72A|nr:tetratricopeptide repeat protein [Qipengyuania sp. S6317L1]MCK0099689.1 tetratricopeptide repeat protein [Qipengyuania sp. S6317L1]
MRFSTASRAALGVAFVFTLTVFAASGAHAQQATSREVVQPLPSTQVQRLNRALLELARQPTSVPAMLEAGDASLDVGDLDAAIGFYQRAAEVDPSDARIKLGLARVYLKSGRPVEAMPLLQEAERAGAPARDVLGEQALAYDLLGDQAAAQDTYAKAIALTPQNDEARRRLGISQAISGDKDSFQATLSPLIEGRDIAAFRARAFGLAILGEQERAEGIVNSVMPPDIAARINPYLAFMPRLTPAQQAAAANLGIFPRAADIGREDPRIARFAQAATSDAKLEPAGEPLGAPTTTPAPEGEPTAVSREAQGRSSLPQVATREIGPPAPPVQPQPRAPVPVPQPQPQTAPQPQPVTPPASVADAFADLGEAGLPAGRRSADAVDITAIDVPREAPPEPEPVTPEHPRRIWVQLATGRDVEALGFDWRRFSRSAPDLLGKFEPHVTPWGQANRLLAGPLENADAARRLVNDLAEKGLDAFTYTSPEGTEITELK